MKEYQLSNAASIGLAMDVRGYNGRLYAICRDNGGSLSVLSKDLELLEVYRGIGNARQIEIRDGIAFITAREDGLWILDVSDIKPRLLAHYRTVEFATGITLCRSLAFVSCRQYGVEIVDVSDPRKPAYVNVVRMGEIQSACVYGNILYGGAWGEMKVVAVDVSDVQNPTVIAEYPLSGRGDGVVVRDGILYASTGQHRRGIRNVTDPADPNFGMGNGVEVFDVHDPKNPKHLGFTFFEKGYSIAFDMWKPMLSGDVLICNNSELGVYGLDALTRAPLFHITLPERNGKPDPVTGTAILDGRLYVTSALGGLSVFDVCPLEDAYRFDEEQIGHASSPRFAVSGSGAALQQCYRGDFPVLAIAEAGEFLALACGDMGIRLVRETTFEEIAHSDPFYCCDVKAYGAYLFAASAEAGLRIYRISGDSVDLFGSYRSTAPILQIELSGSGSYLAAILSGSSLEMLDVRDPAAPKRLYGYRSTRGHLYGENFLSHRMDGAISLFWHREGLVCSDPDNGDNAFRTTSYPIRNGFLGFCPGNGCEILPNGSPLFLRKQGYVLLDPSVAVDDLPVYRADVPIRGKLLLDGDLLYATDRAEGHLTVTDVSDLTHPVTLAALKTNASPGRLVKTASGILCPARYGGLLRLSLSTPQ